MVKYHVDACRDFMNQMNKENAFGRNSTSVQSNPEEHPLIVVGQDECIVKQYSFTNKIWWTGPNRKQALISAFVSRKFGYGITLTKDELQRVNAERHGKQYKDETAAKK